MRSASFPGRYHGHHGGGSGGEVPLPHPIFHRLGPENREQIRQWLVVNEDRIFAGLLVFVCVMGLAGMWRSREPMVEWWCGRRRRQTGRGRGRGALVTVGILRNGAVASERDTLLEACCEERVVKRVRFVEDEGATVVIFDGNQGRETVVVGFREEGGGGFGDVSGRE
ncbi:uncharacterized protein L3040_009215 [Drepanopeziza brunnea f. sp. 'multigermtubi']|nr:hypothetical protein L3040_009215 [Drepanopeziza brunnea f. sp. 'multigermtubi']